jgi:flagellar biosynthesis protein FlhF
MPTHTFIADSANAAVEQIRNELGPSAVVLSVRKLPRNGLSRLIGKDRIEVVASVDDSARSSVPALAPAPIAAPVSRDPVIDLQAEVRALKQQFADMRREWNAPLAANDWLSQYLNDRAILPCFRETIAAGLPARAREDQVEDVLRSKWRSEPQLNGAAVHIFVGVPGSGKSTVLCKMLAQTCLVERHAATLYQLDTHLANSSSKPAIFAEIVGAQYERTMPLAFERREESVFIDLPGVSLGDEKGLNALRPVIQAFGVPEIHLVVNGAYEAVHLLEQVRFFSEIGITGLIVSHLDEETRWGKVWNLVLGTNFVVRHLSLGQNVPGGLMCATPDCLFSSENRGK